MTDYTVGDTLYLMFSTRIFATGIPGTLAGTPVVSAYENDSATQITAGITLGVDHDSVTGLNLLTIVATGANGYEAGKDYNMVITTGTVSSVSVVGEVVGTFSLSRSSAFARLGAPAGASIAADLVVIDNFVDGLETTIGTAGDGLTDITLNAASIDLVWDEVLTGGTHNVNNSSGKRLRELADSSLIRGADFQAGSTTTSLVLDASASSVDDFYNFTIIRIVDGAGAGQERIIADYDGTTKAATITPALVTAAPSSGDEFNIVSGGSVHAETQGGGYEGGAVWVDTSDGVAGTLLYVNGTVDNPSSNIADARTIADALGMHVINSLPGSSFTLAQTFNDFQFVGSGYTVALGGQDIGGSRFFNCAISGVGTGSTRVVFRQCLLVGATTLAVASLLDCNFSADLTLSAASTYRISHGIHGSTTSPVIDFGSAVGNTVVHVHGYNGAVTIENMGQTGTDTLHFDSSGGKLTLDSTCIGGTVNMNGTFDLVDSSSGMTLNKGGTVPSLVWDEDQVDHTGAGTFGEIATEIAAIPTTAMRGTDNAATASALATVDSIVDAILLDTAEIGTAGAGLSDLGGMSTAMKAEVLSEINDALDAAISELGVAAPTATPTVRTALMLMYMALRNKTTVQTSGTDALEINNDAGTIIAQKLLTDDGSDYEEAEMTSG